MDPKKFEPVPLLDRLAVFFATGCWTGFLPGFLSRIIKNRSWNTLSERKWTGAGLIGTFEGTFTFLFLPYGIAHSWIALTAVNLFAVGVSGRAERALNSNDDSRIIIDEWVGAWIAMWGLEQRIGWPVCLAFVLFRLFDVFKGPIGRRLQRLPGGWGVMLDDVYAGFLANIICRISVGFLHISH